MAGDPTRMLLSIVVPVYREEVAIPLFLTEIRSVLAGLTDDYEIIFSLDPSPDRTEEVILAEREKDARIKLLKFSRRFGQPMATLAAMQYSRGQAVVVIDVDLQDPPALIAEMMAKWGEGFEVVYAQRRSRTGETWIKQLVAAVGYKLIKSLSDVEIPPNTGDFRLMSRRVVEEVVRLKECHGFLRGLVALVGFKTTSVVFDRPARVAGKGNYNPFFGSIRIGMNGLICFSNRLLTLSTTVGFIVAFIALLAAGLYLLAKLLGAPFPIGNPTIVILVLFMGGIQLISVGILGEYIARIYDEVKKRPKFIVERSAGFESGPQA